MEIILGTMVIQTKLQGYKPLQYWNNSLLLGKGPNLFISDLYYNNLSYLTTIPCKLPHYLIARLRTLSRIKRIDLGPSITIHGTDEILVCFLNKIYLINILSGNIICDHCIPRGCRPLRLSYINIHNFQPGIYYGEYFSNPNYKSVNIFHRSHEGKWNIAFTFPNGEINHVHGLFPDEFNECVYILTGDFNKGACIWMANNNFKYVERYLENDQTSRACWLVVTKNHNYFATDTPLQINYLCSFKNNSPDPIINKLFPIVGSSIYYSENTNRFISFSTTVEPTPNTKHKFLNYFSTQRGEGIISNRSCVYSGNFIKGFSIVLSAKKDLLPPRLFQFGSFQFPSGKCPNPYLIHPYGVALSGSDNCAYVIDLNSLN